MMNVNVGVMGHVDSGKTSLVAALSTRLSTCALDKHPQSKQRGITLDLGFSSFTIDRKLLDLDLGKDKEASAPEEEKEEGQLQFTLVDCPGHSSLIRTIIGATQIIDVFLLVVDVTKGIQTQTAECLVLAQVSPCTCMLVVLNKIDLIPQAKDREQKVAKMTKMLHKVLEKTKFRDCKIVCASANPGGKEVSESVEKPIGCDAVVSHLVDIVPRRVVEERMLSSSGSGTSCEKEDKSERGEAEAEAEKQNLKPLVYAVDHCFSIRGQGTVLTGTILQGAMQVNQLLHIPKLGIDRKVKSMQVFKQPVEKASSGERVAVCITQLDPKLIERDYLCDALEASSSSSTTTTKKDRTISTFDMCVASANKIDFFKENISSGSKIHVTLGYITVLAEVLFFVPETTNTTTAPAAAADQCFDFMSEYTYLEELQDKVYVFMSFDKPVTCPVNTAYIASRLDLDVHTKQCRLAFHGNILDIPCSSTLQQQQQQQLELAKKKKKKENGDGQRETYLRQLRVFKTKSKRGKLERVEKGNPNMCIASGFFKKDSDISKFIGLSVHLVHQEDSDKTSPPVVGKLVGTFGKSGKVKVEFDKSIEHIEQNADLELRFKKYLFR